MQQEKTNDNNYNIIYNWMLKLGLKTTEVLVYALLYSFTAHHGGFTGSPEYIGAELNLGRSAVYAAFRSLKGRGLIVCSEVLRPGIRGTAVKRNAYTAVTPDNVSPKNGQGLSENRTKSVHDPDINNNKTKINTNRADIYSSSTRGVNDGEGVSKADPNKLNEALEGEKPEKGCAEKRSAGFGGENSGAKRGNRRQGPREKQFSAEFDSIWARYPRKQGKSAARRAYIAARFDGVEKASVERGLDAYLARLEREVSEARYVKQGGNWFIGRCWDDADSTCPGGVKNERGEKPRGRGSGGSITELVDCYTAEGVVKLERTRRNTRALSYEQNVYSKEFLESIGVDFGEGVYGD